MQVLAADERSSECGVCVAVPWPWRITRHHYFPIMTLIHGDLHDITSSVGMPLGPRPTSRWRWYAVVAAMVLGLAACSNSPTADEESPTTPSDVVSPDDGDVGGGTLVLAVEQWPECLNPVTSCANATWTLWSTLVHVLPRLMELDTTNTYVASSLLAVEPSIDNGGLVTADDGTFTLTYQLNPDAAWSDGAPITSTDVWFTWRAALDTTGTLSDPGYDFITNVDHSHPLPSAHRRDHLQRALCAVADAVQLGPASTRVGARHRRRRQVERRDHDLWRTVDPAVMVVRAADPGAESQLLGRQPHPTHRRGRDGAA